MLLQTNLYCALLAILVQRRHNLWSLLTCCQWHIATSAQHMTARYWQGSENSECDKYGSIEQSTYYGLGKFLIERHKNIGLDTLVDFARITPRLSIALRICIGVRIHAATCSIHNSLSEQLVA